MGLLEKLETLINGLIYRLFELAAERAPAPLRNLFARLRALKDRLVAVVRALPVTAKTLLLTFLARGRALIAELNFKEALLETYQRALENYRERSAGPAGKLKGLLLMPFLLVAQWLRGLSAGQALLLLSFSFASVVAVIGIGFSGQKLLGAGAAGRGPASVEVEVAYERPDYYKKQTKHFELTNFRLPVHFADVNEIHSVDVDFTATVSNRHARIFLEKHEFQLRDHLVLNVEPSVATFPLEDEGKEIIRRKLLVEVDEFLKLRGIEGQVVELKITYVLAN
jgi:hypothetical protein